MSDLGDLYQEIILDHYKRPRNAGLLEQPTCLAHGNNPLCGDKISVSLDVKDGRIAGILWKGSGCAISTASASLMSDAVKGLDRAQVDALFHRFHAMVTGTGSPDDLDKLAVFQGVCEYPARVKCASLAWHTLRAALEGRSDPISTE
jgi:nitrogen fixation protein NifU and related proteins